MQKDTHDHEENVPLMREETSDGKFTTAGYYKVRCCLPSRLSQSRSLGFLVWCGRTRLSLARASRSYKPRAAMVTGQYALGFVSHSVLLYKSIRFICERNVLLTSGLPY